MLEAIEENAAERAGPNEPDVKLNVSATRIAIKAMMAPYSLRACPLVERRFLWKRHFLIFSFICPSMYLTCKRCHI